MKAVVQTCLVEEESEGTLKLLAVVGRLVCLTTAGAGLLSSVGLLFHRCSAIVPRLTAEWARRENEEQTKIVVPALLFLSGRKIGF